MTGLDWAVLGLYLVGSILIGLLAGGRQKDATDYFLGHQRLPWLALAFSTVATETSALTVISVPATAYTGDLWFLQLAFGYFIGRTIVAWLILPLHFRRGATTTYAFLQERFGRTARRFASILFLVTRALGDSVRIFAASIPVTLLSGLPYWQSILITGIVTLIYTYWGGLRAVVWVDVLQLIVYISGGFIALWLLGAAVDGGWSAIFAQLPREKLNVFHFEGGPASGQWILTGLVGGAVLSMASHGVDHLVVQRLMAAENLGAARKALMGDATIIIIQFALFLAIGLGMFVYFGGREFGAPDEVFPAFVIEAFPSGLAGLMIAGILAAAMSTLASSINALASSTTHDIYAPLADRSDDSPHLMKMAKLFTLMWGAVLIGGAMLFRFVSQGTPVVIIALEIASFTYGGLLGGFFLGMLSKRATERDAIIGIGSAVAFMTLLWSIQQFAVVDRFMNGLWYALVGSLVTLGVGMLSASRRRPDVVRTV